jgi:hypothetical protein
MLVKTRSALLLLPIAGALACAPSVQMTGQWVDKELFQPGKYSSMFIAVMSQNLSVKQVFENDIATEASSRGIKAVKSGDIFKPNFTAENAGSKEAVIGKIQELGLETIFTVALKDKETTTRYVPGSVMYSPAPYYGGYWGYYSNTYATVYTPGYYTQDKTYYVESNLYEVASGKLLWSVQSEVINPGKVEAVAEEYTSMLLDALNKEGLLRKKQ